MSFYDIVKLNNKLFIRINKWKTKKQLNTLIRIHQSSSKVLMTIKLRLAFFASIPHDIYS
ncbi:hypothetical protein KORDIASMS9_04690 [Kordia sp. SMS9]|nr:hypothetical protein KORDIASMS9_04690 [Kordia sp. SMS9]